MRAALLPLLAVSCTATGLPPATVRPDGMVVEGTADYDWPLRTLDGDTLSLAAFRGRPVFINLWATWCTPCVAELASIEALRQRPDAAEAAFLLVSPEDPERVREFLRRHGYDLPVYLERAPIPDAFGLRALPTTFILDRNGDIVLRHRGAADWDDPAVAGLLRHLARP